MYILPTMHFETVPIWSFEGMRLSAIDIFIYFFLYPLTGGNVSELRKVDGVSHWEFWKNSERKGPRNRFLININEVTGERAFVMGKWKYVKSKAGVPGMSTSSPVSCKFTNFFVGGTGNKGSKLKFGGYAGRDNELSYNLSMVLHSPVHKVLRRYREKKYNEKEFLQLRRKANIAMQGSCKNRTQTSYSVILPCFSKGKCFFFR